MWLDQQEELHSFGPFMSRIRIDGLGRAVFFDMVTSDAMLATAVDVTITVQ